MEYIVYNGEVVPAETWQIPHTDRGFRYGDGFFERIVLRSGKLCFWQEHHQRILKAAALFALDIVWSGEELADQLLQLAAKHHVSEAKIRMQFWRRGGGLYTPETNETNSLFSLQPAEDNRFYLEGIHQVGICDELRKPIHPIFSVKGLHAMPYVLASLFRKKKGWDEALLLNEAGCLCEATNANLFLCLQGKLYTPPLSDGPLDGVIRALLLRKGLAKEKTLRPDNLEEAEEIFLTHSSGIRVISQWQGRQLDIKKAEECSAYIQSLCS
jgi:branched-subunit amino acid aminotransferase/4-amino-4-deoxychorismate lyase